MFRGINSVLIDAKGRIKLPARYRQLLTSVIECPPLVVTIDTDSPCLLLYPAQEWAIIEQKIQELPSFNPAARRVQRLLIGHATEIELDNFGRILLPALLREYAHLEKELRIVGQGKKIELWSAGEWEAYRTQWLAETTQPGDLPDELQTLAL